MSIDPNKSYWYSRDREQRGPVNGAELKQLAQTGQLQPSDLYWCDGMTDWLPLSASGVLAGAGYPPVAPAMAPPPFASMTPSYASSSLPPASFPRAPLRSASFGLFLGLAIGAFLVLIVGGVLLGIASSNNVEPMQVIGGLVLAVGIGLIIGTVVIGAINLYRAWAAIQGLSGVSSTPGMAVGLMFVPFFNLYWGFIAFGKWAKDYNSFVRTHDLSAAPPASEGLFLTYPILAVCGLIPFIGVFATIPQMIIGLICMAQLCNAANFLKAHSEQTT